MRGLVYFISLVLIFSCNGKKKFQNKCFKLNPPLSNQSIALVDLIDSIQYIPLEETLGSFLNGVANLLVYEDQLIVKSFDSNKLHFYSTEGKFLYQLESNGSGPLEYSEVTAFSIDSNRSELIISDRSNGKILFYDLQNHEFIREFPIDYIVTSISVSDSNYIAVSFDPENGYFKYLDNTGSILDAKIKKPDYFNFAPGRQVILRGDESDMLLASFSDTIYRISYYPMAIEAIATIGDGNSAISKFNSIEEVAQELLYKPIQDFIDSSDRPLVPIGQTFINNSEMIIPLYSKEYLIWNMMKNTSILIKEESIENVNLIGTPIMTSYFTDRQGWHYGVISIWIDSFLQSLKLYCSELNRDHICEQIGDFYNEHYQLLDEQENPIIVKYKLRNIL